MNRIENWFNYNCIPNTAAKYEIINVIFCVFYLTYISILGMGFLCGFSEEQIYNCSYINLFYIFHLIYIVSIRLSMAYEIWRSMYGNHKLAVEYHIKVCNSDLMSSLNSNLSFQKWLTYIFYFTITVLLISNGFYIAGLLSLVFSVLLLVVCYFIQQLMWIGIERIMDGDNK